MGDKEKDPLEQEVDLILESGAYLVHSNKDVLELFWRLMDAGARRDAQKAAKDKRSTKDAFLPPESNHKGQRKQR